jgi:predicted site-specific integrase-resolvase
MAHGTCSTAEAAKKAGITRATLQDWIKKGKFNPPKLMRLGNVTARLWKTSDVARLEAVKKKIYQEKHPKK